MTVAGFLDTERLAVAYHLIHFVYVCTDILLPKIHHGKPVIVDMWMMRLKMSELPSS